MASKLPVWARVLGTVVGATILTVWAYVSIITWESKSPDFILYPAYVILKKEHPSDPDLQSYKAFYKSVYPRRVEWLEKLSEGEGISIPSIFIDAVRNDACTIIEPLRLYLGDSEC